MTMIRVRVNPTDSEQYVIYAGAYVAAWPEFELRLPLRPDER